MDEMKAEIDAGVDAIIAKIDIDDLISDPEGYLLGIVEAVKEDIVDKLAERAINAGEALAKSIEKKDEIVIDESGDPQKNKELVDDKSRD
jgi:hypothetical protein